jgi:hypothetical protein
VKTPPSPYRVHLTDEATVVGRGQRIRVWLVRHNDGWIRAKDHPDASLEEARADQRDASCPPGTVWRRSIELTLPGGCLLVCRVSTPLIEELGALEYLMKERRGMRRRVDETYFIVSGNYKLTKAPARKGSQRGAAAPPDADELPSLFPDTEESPESPE